MQSPTSLSQGKRQLHQILNVKCDQPVSLQWDMLERILIVHIGHHQVDVHPRQLMNEGAEETADKILQYIEQQESNNE